MKVYSRNDLLSFLNEVGAEKTIRIIFKERAINDCIWLAGFNEMNFKLPTEWRLAMKKRSWDRGRRFISSEEQVVELQVLWTFDRRWFADRFYDSISEIELVEEKKQEDAYYAHHHVAR